MAEKLKDKKIDVIYTSPLQRAIDTALEIAKYHNKIEILKDDRLIEIDYGECDGMQWKEIDQRYPYVRKLWKEIYHYPIEIPKQENFIDVGKRVKNFMDDLKTKKTGKNICVVSHGIAIQSYMYITCKRKRK